MAKTFTDVEVGRLLSKHTQMMMGVFVNELMMFVLNKQGFKKYEDIISTVSLPQLLSYTKMLAEPLEGNLDTELILNEQAYIELIDCAESAALHATEVFGVMSGAKVEHTELHLNIDVDGTQFISDVQMTALIDVVMETVMPLRKKGQTIGFETLEEIDGVSTTLQWDTDWIKCTMTREGEQMVLTITGRDNNLWGDEDEKHTITH